MNGPANFYDTSTLNRPREASPEDPQGVTWRKIRENLRASGAAARGIDGGKLACCDWPCG